MFGFELAPDEMDAIRQLDTGRSLFFDHHDPACSNSSACVDDAKARAAACAAGEIKGRGRQVLTRGGSRHGKARTARVGAIGGFHCAVGRRGMQGGKLHRYVSRSGPIVAGLLTANALEAAENEGWAIPPPVIRPAESMGFRCYGRLKRQEARLRA